MELLATGSQIDRYVVESMLGQGGVAVVYRVRHQTLGTHHALKVLKIPAPWITERLLREGRAQGRLRHPNLVAVTDVVSVMGAPGLLAELVMGAPLDRFLSAHRPSFEEADLLARGILAGVAAAHGAGFIHRDLKPGNVLLEATGDALVPKISDFGLAKALQADADEMSTRTGAVLGTPAYMAPEQVLDASSVDARADVFALGAILYELVSGVRPFDSRSVGDVMRRQPPAPLQGVPAPLAALIARALDPDPQRRPADAAELAALWGADRPAPPQGAWSAGALEAARAQQQPDRPVPTQLADSFTDSFVDSDTYETATSEETWVSEPVPVAVVPPRWLSWPRLGALSIAAIWLLVGLWLVVPRPGVGIPTASGVPEIEAPAGVQDQLEAAWDATLRGAFSEARAAVEAVRVAAPDAVLPHLLAGLVLHLDGDLELGIKATRASYVAASQDVEEQPGEALARILRNQQESGAAILDPGMRRYLEQQPRDYLALLYGSRYCSRSGAEACEWLHAQLLAQGPELLVAYLVCAEAWMDLGQPDRAVALAERGLALHPGERGLSLVLGRAALAGGDTQRARAILESIAQADPEEAPRLLLAKAILLDGDELAYASLRDELLASSPPEDLGTIHQELALLLAGLGRFEEALGHSQAWRATERSLGNAMGEVMALSQEFNLLSSIARHDASLERIDELVQVSSSSPEIPNPMRNRFATVAVSVHGLVAGYRGDREALAAALRRIETADFVVTSTVAKMRRELAVLDGDAEAIEAIEGPEWTECTRQRAIASALRRAGHPDAAVRRWRQVLEARCQLHTAERAALAAARIGLAEHHLSGDRSAAERHLEAFRRLWPRPDPGLELVARASAVAQRLGLPP